jgi:protein-S-isoprenylcysteine O-methyltransferase Ste14
VQAGSALELKVPPLAFTVICGGVMWLASLLFPALDFDNSLRIPLATAFAATGLLFGLAGIIAFRKAGTTLNPINPDEASSMVTSGVYRVSRNPMYVGLLLALSGWAVLLSNVIPFLFLPAFVLYMTRFNISPEERALFSKFGAEYSAYTRSVRRWI